MTSVGTASGVGGKGPVRRGSATSGSGARERTSGSGAIGTTSGGSGSASGTGRRDDLAPVVVAPPVG